MALNGTDHLVKPGPSLILAALRNHILNAIITSDQQKPRSSHGTLNAASQQCGGACSAGVKEEQTDRRGMFGSYFMQRSRVGAPVIDSCPCVARKLDVLPKLQNPVNIRSEEHT